MEITWNCTILESILDLSLFIEMHSAVRVYCDSYTFVIMLSCGQTNTSVCPPLKIISPVQAGVFPSTYWVRHEAQPEQMTMFVNSEYV